MFKFKVEGRSKRLQVKKKQKITGKKKQNITGKV